MRESRGRGHYSLEDQPHPGGREKDGMRESRGRGHHSLEDQPHPGGGGERKME